MTYDDIREELAFCSAFLLPIKKDISSGQTRNYPNVLNALIKVGKAIRSLEKILDKQDDKNIRRRCDHIKNSAETLHDIVSDSKNKSGSWIKVTGRLESFIAELNDLSELLAEASQSQSEGEEKDGKSKTDDINESTYIKKGKTVWEFGFNGTTAKVEFKPNKELQGLALIEYLLLHKGEEYTPLKLLQETRQRRKEETESEKIYTDKDIEKIKEAVDGLESRLELSSDKEEKERLEQEIKYAKDELYKSRNYRGKSRNFSNKFRLSVTRNINTVLNKIAPQSTQLYNHLDAFLNRGEICFYKPDKEIIWDIS